MKINKRAEIFNNREIKKMDRDSTLVDHPMFKRAVASVKRSYEDSLKNIVDCRENFLFVWSAEDSALLVTNVNSPDTKYQSLRLISAPVFEVERVCVSAGCVRACVWGARGVLVAELPARLHFSTDSNTTLCKSFSLDERLLLSHAEVRRVLWHPDSLSHLLVLVSDNTIRLYNVGIKSPSKLVKCVSVGPTPRARLAGRPMLESLGDTAVDCAATPSAGRLLVLRGNGDVDTLHLGLTDDSCTLHKLRGPLAMYPPADDNYGTDSCGIAVVGGRGGSPPLVIIATCSAVLYHCLLLPDPNSEDSNKAQKDSRASDLALYVVECVELNVALSSEDDSLQYSYPVHLYPIANKSDCYACVHAAGVHTVSLPIMSHMKEYVDADSNEVETVLSSLVSRASVARYAVRTHAPGASPQPPLGAAVLCGAGAPALLLLLPGSVVIRNLEPVDLEEQLYSSVQQVGTDPGFQKVYSMLKEKEKMSFSAIIQDVLTRSVSQPLLKMAGKEEPSPKEAIELLAQATLILSEEYMRKQERAGEVIRRKLHDMATLGRQQAEWFHTVQVQAEDVLTAAVALREKFAAAIEKQNHLRERCRVVLRCATAERGVDAQLLSELRELRGEAERAASRVKRVCEARASGEEQLKSWREEYGRKGVNLGRSHSETISVIIQQQSKQLTELIEETKLLKDQLSIA